tara:strand:- start:1063 stop:1287 length:225 start_codon:yes stop_codon:yes gene_type:complete
MTVKDKAIERIEEIHDKLVSYKELHEQLTDIEMTYDNLDWVDIYKPHHIDIELPRAINEVESKIQEIESKLERI